MSTVLADAPVFGRALKPRWATATTATTANELPESTITSASASSAGANIIYIVLPYARNLLALPPAIGKVVPFEGVFEQVGNIEDAISSSHFLPVFLVPTRGLGFAFCAPHQRASLPSPVHADEIINWDVGIEVAPRRPSGKLNVTLRYRGRATSRPTDNPWDDD